MRRGIIFLTLILVLLSNRPARAQEDSIRPLRLDGIALNGAHSALTESWLTVEVTVANPNSTGRDARVVLFHADQPDVHYARDVWIPPRSSLMTWMIVGPTPPTSQSPRIAYEGPSPEHARELQALIFDRTGNQERLLLPRSEEHVRSRLSSYRCREPLTCLLTDESDSPEEPEPYPPPPFRPEANDVLDLVRAFRAGCSLSERVQSIHDNFIPPTPAALDGVEQFVLAGRRLDQDPPGQVVLRRWVEQGGKLWVMLDRTDPDLVARILGGEAGFHIVDRTSLTSVRIEGRGSGQSEIETSVRDFEQPLEFVRVKLTPEFTVLHTVDGWPASFIRPVGQGSVLITTLGARAWSRPREKTDPKSPYPDFPIPVLMPAMDALLQELRPAPLNASSPSGPSFPNSSFGASEWNSLTPLVKGDIGYSVVGVGAAGLMFGGFLLTLLLLGIGLRRSRRSEFLGWLGPAAAVLTAGAFLAIGEVSRRAVAPTVAVTELVAVNPGASEQAITGLLGYYRPDAGPTKLGSNQGGLLELDMAGLQGQNRRLVVTDIDNWHWENLALPTGIRQGPFRSEVRKTGSMAATARFGPEGLEGKVSAGPFYNLADAVIYAPSRRAFAVHLRADGTFSSGESDLLSPGQFIAGSVLSDQQQRRQSVYRHFLKETKAGQTWQDSLLLAWADPTPLPFEFDSGVRTTGSAFLSFPLRLERSSADSVVTVPRAFIPFRRIIPFGVAQPTMEAPYSVDEHLRFEVPHSVLPLKVERARLYAKVEAPMRRFIVKGKTKNGSVELLNVANPIDLVTVDIRQPELLELDERGGFHLDIGVTDPEVEVEGPLPKWTIQSLELEITGRTQEKTKQESSKNQEPNSHK